MGSGASRGLSVAVAAASDTELQECLSVLPTPDRAKVLDAIKALEDASGKVHEITIEKKEQPNTAGKAARIRIVEEALKRPLDASNIGMAAYLHKHLRPPYWGVSRSQLQNFFKLVVEAVTSGDIMNVVPDGLPQYEDWRFKKLGPTIYQVVEAFIKPRTSSSSGNRFPFASWALMDNAEDGGLECDLFVSHAWAEGAYEFQKNMHWPHGSSSAYICFLSNPQHLDISSLVSSPKTSPFYLVLENGVKHVIMLSNMNCTIHSRLWCVFEAYCAMEMGIPVEIAGNGLALVVSAKISYDTVDLGDADDGDNVWCDDDSVLMTLTNNSRDCRVDRNLAIQVAKGRLKVAKAKCFSAYDREAIWAMISGRESEVDSMIMNLIRVHYGLPKE